MRPFLPSLLLLTAGCSNATLSDMRSGFLGSDFYCWLTLSLKQAPAGEVRDLKVRFSSVVLVDSQEFDWAYIATHDHLERVETDWMGNQQVKFDPDLATTADQDPRPGTKLKVKFDLAHRSSGTLKAGERLVLDASLSWAGKQQDSMSRGMLMSFEKK